MHGGVTAQSADGRKTVIREAVPAVWGDSCLSLGLVHLFFSVPVTSDKSVQAPCSERPRVGEADGRRFSYRYRWAPLAPMPTGRRRSIGVTSSHPKAHPRDGIAPKKPA